MYPMVAASLCVDEIMQAGKVREEVSEGSAPRNLCIPLVPDMTE